MSTKTRCPGRISALARQLTAILLIGLVAILTLAAYRALAQDNGNEDFTVYLHPNDVQLVRVYPREKGGKILEETIPSDAEFEVVVEAKAGAAIHGSGGKYSIQIVVRDLTDFTVVHRDNLEGNLAYEPWDEPVFWHAFPVPAQGPAKEYHIYEVLASLQVGVRNPNVTFTKSPLFIIW